ncbi:FAD-dependent oxidoreductase domain-containing protein 1-like [Portunus trituberculatus]|uniref:FAD-dependent oxidoreductase domain-containing protein 1-like n=1 Tax=Portunus trituberculatus TaxID=210409 RepID=UPI001E1CF939|nr:FAD-dependent oxidoreductase domain-containing protein 1-like [Portunus trituberculatus]XP_045117785.1 FAD-dependent oxidoreductase domain-containing protein 1-like [Portunus trituberculatus]
MIRTLGSFSVVQRAWAGVWRASRCLATGCSSAWPRSCDVLVVGGGAVGSSSAYHLKHRAGRDLSVVVLEQDSTYEKASTVLSLGNIRQQFSVAENTLLSLYGASFLRRAPELLAVEGQDPVDLRFFPRGYLFLATPEGLKQMEENYKQQTSLGAEVAWLWPDQLRKVYPWFTFKDNVVAGVLGTNNEGWFDPWSLLLGMRRKAESLGALYLPAKLTGLQYRQEEPRQTTAVPTRSLTTAQVRLKSGEEREISFSTLVVAAGGWSGEVGRLAGLGTGEGVLATPIPVEPRKRFIYCAHAPDGPWEGCPVFNDYTGMYFRPDTTRPQYFFCGRSPLEEEEPDPTDLSVDYSFFDTHLWPQMVERCPEFGNLKVKSAWAGYYDYNTLDQNLILGFHPVYTNMCIATGLSGHGIQQSPAVGRAVMECVVDGRSHSINLDRFSFDRILTRQPLKEKMVM